MTPEEQVIYMQKIIDVYERMTSAVERIADRLDSWDACSGTSHLDTKVIGSVDVNR